MKLEANSMIFTFGGMDEPSRLHHIHCPLLGPLVNLIPLRTLVCRGICHRNQAVRGPLERDQTNVGMAHGGLTEEIEAVLCRRQWLGQSC